MARPRLAELPVLDGDSGAVDHAGRDGSRADPRVLRMARRTDGADERDQRWSQVGCERAVGIRVGGDVGSPIRRGGLQNVIHALDDAKRRVGSRDLQRFGFRDRHLNVGGALDEQRRHAECARSRPTACTQERR